MPIPGVTSLQLHPHLKEQAGGKFTTSAYQSHQFALSE